DAAVRCEPEKREAQRVLARQITALVHGPEAVREAERSSTALFESEGRTESDLGSFDGGTLPGAFVHAAEPQYLWSILKEAGIVASASEARRLITQGGVAVDHQRVPGTDFKLGEGRYLVQLG